MRKPMSGPLLYLKAITKFKQDEDQEIGGILEKVCQKMGIIKRLLVIVKMGAHNYILLRVIVYCYIIKIKK